MHYDPSSWELLTQQQSITSQKMNLQPYNVLLSDEMIKPFKSDTSLQLGHTWCVDHTQSCRLSQQCT